MKILIVGANSNYAIERFYLKYLAEIPGVQVELFEAQNMFLSYYQKSLFTKIIFRLGYQNIYDKINSALSERIVTMEPEIIFVFKGMEIYPKTLRWAKSKGIKLVNYNPDNPFIFSGRGSGNSNISNSISLYDLHFTYNLEVKKIIEDKYNIPAYWLPFGFDIPEGLFESISDLKEIIKTSFVGNPDRNRVKFLYGLAEKGIAVDLYGNNWEKFLHHKNINIYHAVYGSEFWQMIRQYRVQLNPLRKHNLDSHGMRSFEIPAIGGIMLAPVTSEHIKFFKDGEESFFYMDPEDAVLKINDVLSLSQNEANKIRNNAREKSLSSGYSYKHRVNELYKILKCLET